MSDRPWLEHYDDGVPEKIDYPEVPLFYFLEKSKLMVKKMNEYLAKGNNAEAINHFNKALNYMEAHKEEVVKNKAVFSDLYNDLAHALIKVSRQNDAVKIFDKVDLNAVVSMGLIAERLAAMYHISREEQDQWALRGNLRAAAAQREGKFKHEIIPVEGKLPDGTVKLVDYDQGVRPDSTIEKIRSLTPLYKPDGTICAASASDENDGAAVAVLMSKEKAEGLSLVPMVTIRNMAWVGVDPEIMGYGATVASRKALERAGLSIDDIDLVEINEAFTVLPLLQIKEMGIDPEKVNVNGGACCIGHPTGASGMRVLGTLAYEMNRRRARYGLAAICGAWGAGAATVVEREEYWEGRRAFSS